MSWLFILLVRFILLLQVARGFAWQRSPFPHMPSLKTRWTTPYAWPCQAPWPITMNKVSMTTIINIGLTGDKKLQPTSPPWPLTKTIITYHQVHYSVVTTSYSSCMTSMTNTLTFTEHHNGLIMTTTSMTTIVNAALTRLQQTPPILSSWWPMTKTLITCHRIGQVSLVCNYDMEGDKLYSVKWWVRNSFLYTGTHIEASLFAQVSKWSGVLQIHSNWHARHNSLPLSWDLCWCAYLSCFWILW